jgi:alcohol dehydrogenase (NADP+)
VNCLFVGAGAIAEEYAAGLGGSRLSLAGVCDLDAERAESLAAAHGARAFDDLDAALAAVDAPVVVNLTSHAAHAGVTETALAAGRHVYSQKPLALDAGTAADLVAAAEREGLGLACAPAVDRHPDQRRAGRVLASGRPGRIGVGYAHAHVGRVTDWHDRPEAFLDVGPLYDGGVYPLALLTAWFGPVERVRTADALDLWPEADPGAPATTHVEATLEFAAGPVVRLTASLYVPHRAREFYGLELHGDDGSLYLADAGGMAPTREGVRFGRLGRGYTAVPPQAPAAPAAYLDAVERFAAAVAGGDPPTASGRRGAHVVAVCGAVERAGEDGGPVCVPDLGVAADPVPAPVARPQPDEAGSVAAADPDRADGRDRAIRLPPVGFGCSRYRGGEYVDRVDSVATALDAGYRLLDGAELYGNERRIGDLLAARGAPDREGVFLVGKVWRTNHRREHLLKACAGSLEELGIDAFDCYALHWPGAWEHQGSLDRLAEKPVERQEALTFPEDEDGQPLTDDVSLTEAWANLEAVHDRGWARTLGLCNVSVGQVRDVLAAGEVSPALVQVERHPYRPRADLVEFCHDRGIRVVAHSPLSAPGLLDEPVLEGIADEQGLSPAEVVLAWNVADGVVPIPASVDPDHVVANLAAAGERLDPGERARIDGLVDPDFER